MSQRYKDISVKFIFVSISSGGDGTNYLTPRSVLHL